MLNNINYKTHKVFECESQKSSVNPYSEFITDFDINLDKRLMSYCFFGKDKVPFFEEVNEETKITRNKKKKTQKKKKSPKFTVSKKNKSAKK